jgi:hypothetical protein
MADERSHISWSFMLGMFYCGLGAVAYDITPEITILGFILVVIGGIIPNIDSSDAGWTGELPGLFGALVPIIFLQSFPHLATNSVRIALTLFFGFALSRWVFSYLTKEVFLNRGALHSIPAVILFFEIAYLLFPDISWKLRTFLGGALAIGAFSHLLIDSFTNLSIVQKTVKPKGHSGSVLKFSSSDARGTWALYLGILTLGWFVAKDFKPNLSVRSPVTVSETAPSK